MVTEGLGLRATAADPVPKMQSGNDRNAPDRCTISRRPNALEVGTPPKVPVTSFEDGFGPPIFQPHLWWKLWSVGACCPT